MVVQKKYDDLKKYDMESLAGFIVMNSKCSMRIIELMQEESNYEWLHCLNLLIENSWDCASIIADSEK